MLLLQFFDKAKKYLCERKSRRLPLQILFCLSSFFQKKIKLKKKKNHDFIEKGNLSEKVVIVDEELDDTDIDDIRNLGDSPKLVFINEEYGNLRWFL